MTISIDIQDLTQIIRVYEDGSYEERSSYIACATIIFHSKTEVSVTALSGNVTRDAYIKVWNYLYDKGVKVLHFDREDIRHTKEINCRK